MQLKKKLEQISSVFTPQPTHIQKLCELVNLLISLIVFSLHDIYIYQNLTVYSLNVFIFYLSIILWCSWEKLEEINVFKILQLITHFKIKLTFIGHITFLILIAKLFTGYYQFCFSPSQRFFKSKHFFLDFLLLGLSLVSEGH